MARLIHSPTGSGPQGPFEPQVVETLRKALPDDYLLLPNFSLKEQRRPALEYDLVVLAPHAIYVVEAKEWYGKLTGDDQEWLLNGVAKKCPMWLVEQKAKVLKGRLGAPVSHVWFEAMLVVPPSLQLLLGGSWAWNVMALDKAAVFLADTKRLRTPADIRASHAAIIKSLQGAWGSRHQDRHRRIGGWEITETISIDADSAEFLARRTFAADPAVFRIRTWQVSPYLPANERELRLAVIKRPTEALARIGPHPNLLPILTFDFLEEDDEYYEVTEWSAFGTLHGFLRNAERGPLTLRERLQIAEGVAAALDAVHHQDVVHRNVCPEVILLGADRHARLADFDRAYLEKGKTVFPATADRRRNPAYVPPELSDASDYDFDSCSDMYSMGVLLYELLAGKPPFESPEAARAARGRPEPLPAAISESIDPELPGLIERLLSVDDFRTRPTAGEVVGTLRRVLESERERASVSTPLEKVAGVPDLKPGDVIDQVFRVDAELGRGAFSRVYRVFHLDMAKTFALKVLARAEDSDLILREGGLIRDALPRHPNIAQIFWMHRLEGVPYLVSEFVNGETLEPYTSGRKRLAWGDIREIGIQILGALDALHNVQPSEGDVGPPRHGLLHRDIKPANIMLELPTHRPKLIDFNIAEAIGKGTSRVGTPRYWAPDAGRPEWRPDMDLFSFGIVLYELVTQTHPFPDNNPEAGPPIDPRVARPDLRLSAKLSEFLLQAIQPLGRNRFQTARAMQKALEAVFVMQEAPAPTDEGAETFPGIKLLAAELGRPDYNPYVTRLLSLYSQARSTNAGTRGLDDTARLTYVETRLDRELAPALAQGRFRLVLITGNAGDGKTAFLQKVEEKFRGLGAMVELLPSGNGSCWVHRGLKFQTNYDGSQDEGDRSNEDVLAAFLSPFRGPKLPGLATSEVRLLAINEGRLLDVLSHGKYGEDFEGLREFVKNARAGEAGAEEGTLLVNLNLRSVSAGGPESIVEKQCLALLQPSLWEPCQRCAHKLRCPLKHNADTLADGASGPAVRERLRRLLEVVHLRRRAHVTMRDLRSALSWFLFRDHGCADVAALLLRSDSRVAEDLAELYYPDAFATAEETSRSTVDDRLVRLLREVDVGRVESPREDRRLSRDPETAVPWMTFERRSGEAIKIVEALEESAPDVQGGLPFADLLAQRRALLARRRRWAYFERRDEGWRGMLPFRVLDLLEDATNLGDEPSAQTSRETLKRRVIEAISRGEGVRDPRLLSPYMALRVSRVKHPRLRTFRLFPTADFELSVEGGGALSHFLEMAPDHIELRALPHLGPASLKISLDLLEMLDKIRTGYRPDLAAMQGLFVNLQIFRNELLNLPFESVLAVEEDGAAYEISASVGARGDIRLRLARHGEAPEREQAQ